MQKEDGNIRIPYHSFKTSQAPYITAYMQVDVLPLTLVIGGAKHYKYEKTTYTNKPLKPNASYIYHFPEIFLIMR